MSPSKTVPSGIATRTSRSTVTSYFRSDVDHLRVNTIEDLFCYRFAAIVSQAVSKVKRVLTAEWSPTRFAKKSAAIVRANQ